MIIGRNSHYWLVTSLILLLCNLSISVMADEDLPELEEVQAIAQMAEPPLGVIFTIREFDDDALEWVLPRVKQYVTLLRQKLPDINIAMMSHGDELAAASIEQRKRYPTMHQLLEKLVRNDRLLFHVCNTAAGMLDLDEEDFPDYVNVVPFGPSQVQDYLSMGYELVDLELTW